MLRTDLKGCFNGNDFRGTCCVLPCITRKTYCSGAGGEEGDGGKGGGEWPGGGGGEGGRGGALTAPSQHRAVTRNRYKNKNKQQNINRSLFISFLIKENTAADITRSTFKQTGTSRLSRRGRERQHYGFQWIHSMKGNGNTMDFRGFTA